MYVTIYALKKRYSPIDKSKHSQWKAYKLIRRLSFEFKMNAIQPWPSPSLQSEIDQQQKQYYIRQMRYQAKSTRSLSYLLKESQNALEHKLKQNKENANLLNLPLLKEKPFKDIHHQIIPEEPRLKSRSSTGVSVSSFIRKVGIPEQLKKTYTQLVMDDYLDDISSYMCESTVHCQCEQMLLRHEISSSLRSKMVDWMIEVLSSYKMSEETFFKSVFVMDSYMKKCRTKLEVKDLHLVGIAAMFIASKYEEIHPLKLEVLYDKIARKKFRKAQILEKESDIVEVLSFTLENASVYDISRIITQKIKDNFSYKAARYFEKIVLYLSKMVLFNSELAGKSFDLLAGGVAYISLKTLEQAEPEVNSEKYLPELCESLNIDVDDVIEISRKVLDLAKNYSSYFPTLTNLKKFNKFQYNLQ